MGRLHPGSPRQVPVAWCRWARVRHGVHSGRTPARKHARVSQCHHECHGAHARGAQRLPTISKFCRLYFKIIAFLAFCCLGLCWVSVAGVDRRPRCRTLPRRGTMHQAGLLPPTKLSAGRDGRLTAHALHHVGASNPYRCRPLGVAWRPRPGSSSSPPVSGSIRTTSCLPTPSVCRCQVGLRPALFLRAPLLRRSLRSRRPR